MNAQRRFEYCDYLSHPISRFKQSLHQIISSLFEDVLMLGLADFAKRDLTYEREFFRVAKVSLVRLLSPRYVKQTWFLNAY